MSQFEKTLGIVVFEVTRMKEEFVTSLRQGLMASDDLGGVHGKEAVNSP